MGELEECGRGGKGADGPKREVHGGRRRCQVQEREGVRETDRHGSVLHTFSSSLIHRFNHVAAEKYVCISTHLKIQAAVKHKGSWSLMLQENSLTFSSLGNYV